MTAQLTKPTTKASRKPTSKQVSILKTKQEHPDLTTREIAAICDTGHSHVIATLQRYGIDRTHVEDYKKHRADILAGLQHRLLISVTDEDIKKSPMGSRILAAAQLFDKERLQLDLSTANQASVFADIAALKGAKRVQSGGNQGDQG
jgi:hypothetical protein